MLLGGGWGESWICRSVHVHIRLPVSSGSHIIITQLYFFPCPYNAKVIVSQRSMCSTSPFTHEIVFCDLSEFVFLSPIRNENSSRCPLKSISATDSKRLFICHLNRIKMFVQMDIQVHQEGMLIHNRSLLVEMVCKLFCFKFCFKFCYGICCAFFLIPVRGVHGKSKRQIIIYTHIHTSICVTLE